MEPTNTPGSEQSHADMQMDGAYQNTNYFLWFLVIHRDSIDLFQFISDMNQSYHTQTQFCISPNAPIFHCSKCPNINTLLCTILVLAKPSDVDNILENVMILAFKIGKQSRHY